MLFLYRWGLSVDLNDHTVIISLLEFYMLKRFLSVLLLSLFATALIAQSPFQTETSDSVVSESQQEESIHELETPELDPVDVYTEAISLYVTGNYYSSLKKLKELYEQVKDSGNDHIIGTIKRRIDEIEVVIEREEKQASNLYDQHSERIVNEDFEGALRKLLRAQAIYSRISPEKYEELEDRINRMRIYIELTRPEIDRTRKALEDNFSVALAGQAGSDWDEINAQKVLEALESLPENFRKHTGKIVRTGPTDVGSSTTLGYVFSRRSPQIAATVRHRTVYITDLCVAEHINRSYSTTGALSGSNRRAELTRFQRTLVHEMVHTFQNFNHTIMRDWEHSFWKNSAPQGLVPTHYGKTNPYEDMAESVAEYWLGGRIETRPKGGRTAHQQRLNGITDPETVEVFVSVNGNVMDMERYNYIKEHIMDGVEYLVPNP